MAAIGSIQPLWDSISLDKTTSKDNTASSQNGFPVFADVFQNAMNDVKQTDAEYNQAQYLLATGQLDNPAVATIAGYESAAFCSVACGIEKQSIGCL